MLHRALRPLSLVAGLVAAAPCAAFGQSARDPIPIDEIARPPAGGKDAGKRGPGKPGKVPAAAERPRLVVLIVADQLRWEFLTRYAPDFGPDGFRRLMEQGAVFQGHYGQQNTYTGPGHALIATGSYGYVNGIIQNKWFNRDAGRSEAMLFDPGAKLLVGETTPEDETSPRNLMGSTVGDELRLASPDSKVVAVGLKERGTIALGGRMGHAYFHSEVTGEMTSSTWYMQALPDWVKAFNGKKPTDASFGKTWERLLPADRYPEVDDSKFESDVKGLGRGWPKKVTGKLAAPGPDFYTAFQATPFGTDLTFDFARAALDGERLGQRGVTDLLAVSISPTDLAGHAFGPYSQEMRDVTVRLDRSLGAFLKDLDKRYKPGEVLIAFTSDHGAVPIPEWSAEKLHTGHRLKKASIKETVNKALSGRFGAGEWVVALEDPSVYLDRALIASRKLDPAEVERVAGEACLTLPGISGFHTRTQLLNGWVPPTRGAEAVVRSYYPARSGDVVLVQAPFSFWGKYAEKDHGSTHGSFYRYDTDVPILLWGKPFTPGFHGETEMVDLAPTLTRLLGVNPPAGCEGEVLEEALR